jgi:hypothetical protein
LFSGHQDNKLPDPSAIYAELSASFGKTLDHMGKAKEKMAMKDAYK